jgi:hypothetical protein
LKDSELTLRADRACCRKTVPMGSWAHYRLGITESVTRLADALLRSPPTDQDSFHVPFEGEHWAGWCINGCRLVRRGGFVLGYEMSGSNNTDGWFPEAEPLLARIPGKKQAVRLFMLNAGRTVHLHEDEGEYYLRRHWREVRKVHVPILTNDNCFNFELRGGTEVKHYMKPGEFWYLNGTKSHGAANLGRSARWHLVVDVDPSEQLDKLLAEANTQ